MFLLSGVCGEMTIFFISGVSPVPERSAEDSQDLAGDAAFSACTDLRSSVGGPDALWTCAPSSKVSLGTSLFTVALQLPGCITSQEELLVGTTEAAALCPFAKPGVDEVARTTMAQLVCAKHSRKFLLRVNQTAAAKRSQCWMLQDKFKNLEPHRPDLCLAGRQGWRGAGPKEQPISAPKWPSNPPISAQEWGVAFWGWGGNRRAHKFRASKGGWEGGGQVAYVPRLVGTRPGGHGGRGGWRAGRGFGGIGLEGWWEGKGGKRGRGGRGDGRGGWRLVGGVPASAVPPPSLPGRPCFPGRGPCFCCGRGPCFYLGQCKAEEAEAGTPAHGSRARYGRGRDPSPRKRGPWQAGGWLGWVLDW